MMAGKTPNLDKLAAQGMTFTDYYAEASCTAGRANFIMGEVPLSTGMTRVGQAGPDVSIAARAATIASVVSGSRWFRAAADGTRRGGGAGVPAVTDGQRVL